MKSVGNTIFRGAVILMALQCFAHVAGLLKQLLVASWFGTSETMDAYLIAVAVVGLIQVLVLRPIRQCVIPMFRHDLAQHGERTAWLNLSVLFNSLTVVLVFIVVAGWLLAPYIVAVVAPGFDAENAALASSLARMTLVSVLFFGMAKILSQVLLSYGHVLLPGSMDALDNIVVGLAFLALASSYGIYGLAIGVVIGCAAQLLFQLPILWQKRDMYSAQLNLFHPAMREMAKLALPALFATSGKQVAKITDRIFASMLPPGSLSALSYANGLMAVVKELFVEAPDQAIFPHLTKLSAERKFQDLSRQLFNYVRIVFFITLPIGIGAMVLAEPIVRLVYHRGAFDETSVLTTSQALMFYSIGFPAYGLTNILSRTFFGMKDTWTPTKVAFLRHGSRIALAWVLIQWIGHAGIALADSLSSVVSGVCLFLYLPAEIKGDEGWKTVKSFGQTIGATALMLGVVYFAKERWIEILSGPIGVFALIVLGGAIYAVAAVLTRRKDMDIVVHGLTGLLPNALTRKP